MVKLNGVKRMGGRNITILYMEELISQLAFELMGGRGEANSLRKVFLGEKTIPAEGCERGVCLSD
jgi:hypothetical protein